jgi:arylsulfatase
MRVANAWRVKLSALLVICVAIGVSPSRASSAESAAARPNILIILADDMGYSDLGCFGGEMRTPNLDALAKNGLRFTQFYNTARCCPTRACLLTGLYPHQAGIGHMTDDKGHDGYRGELNRQCVTIAEVLQPAGYRTYMVGKWHVVRNANCRPEGDKSAWPIQRGFDRFYGTIIGGGSFYDPGGLTRDNTMTSPFADSEYRPERFYYTDALSDHAVRFVREHHEQQSAERPLFMYLAYTAAHWPMHALEEDIAKQRGKYVDGYEPIRTARFKRLKELGLVDPRWELSPQFGKWNTVEHKEWQARGMEVYAAMIDRMDQGIGRVVDELRRTGRLDNTLIFFLQDNGACQEVTGRTGADQRVAEPTLPKIAADSIRLEVIPKQTRDGFPVIQGTGVLPGPRDTYIAYGEAWANVSNTPFRMYKHFVHEGGISTPLIAHWPAGIPAPRRNQFVRDPGHLIDLMATCVDVGGATYPRERQGQAVHPREGISLRPAFAGQPLNRTSPILWEHEGNRAIRDGQWKLVAKEDKPWELYDLEADRTEQHDLSESQPNRVRELAEKWETWAKRANVLPVGTWKSKPAQQKKAAAVLSSPLSPPGERGRG